ncbi:MAG: hypothetical protein LBL91_02120 [Lachnospiraceae bacterium]|jgi:hypothetical protein|nr:hypothetical protein [Lachnospiraceae bacterium]
MQDKKTKLGELGEDATKYGEFVCTEHQWLPPKEQKAKSKKLENITKDEND